MQNLLLNLNNIVSLMTKNIKIDIPKYKPLNEEKIDLNENNEKIINRYKNEYEILNKRYEQLKDEKYINNLEKKKDTIIKNLNNLKREIKDLKNEQKMKSIIMTKELKNSKLKLIKTQRVETEYNNLKLKYNNLCNQRERNEQVKKDNEAKLEELKQFKNKIEEMGKEMYDIKEFINVNESNQLEKNKVILKNSLDKKLNIIDGAFIIHKNKYEKEISIREKKIFEKEKEKLKLLKEMRYETIRNEKLIGKIKELYEPIEHLNDENEENLTQHNKGIFIELAKKEKEKEELLKEKTLLKKELEDLINEKKNKPKKNEDEDNINEIDNKKKEEKQIKKDEKENILINTKSSRKPDLNFGKVNPKKDEFSNLLIDNDKENDNEEKEPLNESVIDDDNGKNEIEFKNIEIDKNENIYNKINNKVNELNNNKDIKNNEDINSENNNNENINNENINNENINHENINNESNNNESNNNESNNNENNNNENNNNENNNNENDDDINQKNNNIDEKIENDNIKNENIDKNDDNYNERERKFIERFNEELKQFDEKKQNTNNFNDEIMEDEKRRRNELNDLLKDVEPKKGKDTVPIDVTDFQNVIPS